MSNDNRIIRLPLLFIFPPHNLVCGDEVEACLGKSTVAAITIIPSNINKQSFTKTKSTPRKNLVFIERGLPECTEVSRKTNTSKELLGWPHPAEETKM